MKKNLIPEVSAYVTNLFEKYGTANLLYHNLEHTKNVLQRTYEIAAHYKINQNESFILIAAASFHDTGHLFGDAQDHEKRSVSVMRDYFETIDVKEEITNTIAECIMATKIPGKPKTLSEQIICDADTYNLGTHEFTRTDDLLKREFELRNNTRVTNWAELTLDFFAQHTYFTPYCKALLTPQKLMNMNIVLNNLKKDNKGDSAS